MSTVIADTWLNRNGTENYKCRAWINFDGLNNTTDYGLGANGIRGRGNVSSVTRNGTGDFTINFTTAISDANYSVVATSVYTDAGANYGMRMSIGAGANNVYAGITTTSCRMVNKNEAGVVISPTGVFVAVFR